MVNKVSVMMFMMMLLVICSTIMMLNEVDAVGIRQRMLTSIDDWMKEFQQMKQKADALADCPSDKKICWPYPAECTCLD